MTREINSNKVIGIATVVLLAFVFTFSVLVQPLQAQTFITAWGSSGSGNGQFINPVGVAVDSSSNVYAVDMGNNRIQKFTSTGTFITTWGSVGSDDGQFANPTGIAVDSSNNVYVVDSNNHRIEKFDSTGTFIGWAGKCTGGSNCDTVNQRSIGFSCTATTCTGLGLGTGNGQFNTATNISAKSGIAIDPSTGDVYVADTNNARIQKFTSTGTFITTWGSVGSGNGQFDLPEGIAIDSASGDVYVADTNNNIGSNNNRIQKFTSTGTFITTWGSSGSGNGEFNTPYDVAVDPSTGDVYVADGNNNRIQKFTSTGTFITTWGSSGFGNGEFFNPIGVAVDLSASNIYVADFGNHRIQVFSSQGESTPPEPRLWAATFIQAGDGVGPPDELTFGIDLPGANVFADVDDDDIIDIGTSVAQGTERFHSETFDIAEITDRTLVHDGNIIIAEFTPPLISGDPASAIIIDSSLTVDDIDDFVLINDITGAEIKTKGSFFAQVAEIDSNGFEMVGGILGQDVDGPIVDTTVYDVRMPIFSLVHVGLTELRPIFPVGDIVVKLDAVDPSCVPEGGATATVAFGVTCVHASQIIDFQEPEADNRDSDALIETGDSTNLSIPKAELPAGGVDSWDTLIDTALDPEDLQTGFDRDPLNRRAVDVGTFRTLDLERVALANGGTVNDRIRITLLFLSAGDTFSVTAGFPEDSPIQTIRALPQKVVVGISSATPTVIALENTGPTALTSGTMIFDIPPINQRVTMDRDVTVGGQFSNNIDNFRIRGMVISNSNPLLPGETACTHSLLQLIPGTQAESFAVRGLSAVFSNSTSIEIVPDLTALEFDGTALSGERFTGTFRFLSTSPCQEETSLELRVSPAENPAFQNHFFGPQIVQVIINDPLATEADTSTVNLIVNNFFTPKVHLNDGLWYSFFAEDESFGILMDILTDGRRDNTIWISKIVNDAGPQVEIGGELFSIDTAVDDSFVAEIEVVGGFPFVEVNQVDIFPSLPQPFFEFGLGFNADLSIGAIDEIGAESEPNDFNAICDNFPDFPSFGIAGLSVGSGFLAGDPDCDWPYIKLISLDEGSYVDVRAGFIDTTLVFDDFPESIASGIDRSTEYRLREAVIPNFIDFMWNINPVDNDIVLFVLDRTTGRPTNILYQPALFFDPAINGQNFPDLLPAFADPRFGFDERQALELDPEGVDVLGFINAFSVRTGPVAFVQEPFLRAFDNSRVVNNPSAIVGTFDVAGKVFNAASVSVANPGTGVLQPVVEMFETDPNTGNMTSLDTFFGGSIIFAGVCDGTASFDYFDIVSVAAITCPPNNRPSADQQSTSTDEDTPVVITLMGSDADSDTLTFFLIAPPANGTLSYVTPLSETSSQVTYTPNPNFNGADSFAFRVVDDFAGSNTATVDIAVNAINDVPVANAGGPYSADEGASIAFDGSASSDLDGLVVEYLWNFGDGTSDSGANPNHAYADNGVYTVILTVTDNQGAMHNDTATATINNIAPSVDTESSLIGIIGQAILFAAGFSDPGTADTHMVLWDFGDNSTSDLLEPEHVYNSLGNFTATLIVTDDDEGSDTASVNVTVTSSLDARFCGKAIEEFDNVIDGTASNDVLTGTSGKDLIRGFGGDDKIIGRGNDDCLIGGIGNDTVEGRGGNDMIEGNSGNDILKGGAGNDTLTGGAGNDTLTGGMNNDTLIGDSGDDIIKGGAGKDSLSGNLGNDALDGQGGSDTCVGGFGINTIINCES